jgi:hypothetical protein
MLDPGRIGQRSSIQSLVEQALSGPIPDTVNAYQPTAAIKCHRTDLFAAIGEGRETSQPLALRCGASNAACASFPITISGWRNRKGYSFRVAAHRIRLACPFSDHLSMRDR